MSHSTNRRQKNSKENFNLLPKKKKATKLMAPKVKMEGPTYCDGFAQSIKLWSQKNSLLGKHIPTNAQPTIEGHSLLGKGPVNTSRGNEHTTIGWTSISREWMCFLCSPPRCCITVGDSGWSGSVYQLGRECRVEEDDSVSVMCEMLQPVLLRCQ
jgi:hypothetical protein